MRTREELDNEIDGILKHPTRKSGADAAVQGHIRELLLDIRDLLSHLMVELTGGTMSDKEYRDLFNPPKS